MSSNQTSSPAGGEAVETTTDDASETDHEATTTAVEAQLHAPEDGPAAVEVGDTQRPRGPVKRALSWCGRRWVALLIAVLLVASAGAAGGVYWWMYRPDQLTDAAAQQQALAAAKQGTAALLSYAPDSLENDLNAAKSHLTGEFLKYYSQFTDQIVAPAAKQKGVTTKATVLRAAVSEMHPDKAAVLVFVNQVTTSKDRPDPALASSSVMVTLVKSHGNWLISEFNPV